MRLSIGTLSGETLPGGRAVIVYGGMLFGSLCWGLSQRSKGLTDELK